MSGPFKNVVVVGGSGNLGPAIVKELLAAKLSVTAVKRQESSSTYPDGVTVIPSDFSEDSLTEAFAGKDAVISLVGAPGLGHQTVLIDAAVKAGVKRFFPSEFGSDTTNEGVAAEIPLFAVKIDTVKYLKTKENDGLTWSAIVTGPFFDWCLQAGFFDLDLKNKTAAIWDSGNHKFTGTNLATIGKAIVAILTKPDAADATKNQYVNTSSYTVSQNEVLAALEDITGSKWPKTNKIADEEVKKAKVGLAGGNHFAVYEIIKAHILGDAARSNAADFPGGLFNDKLGLPKEDLKQDLRKIVGGSA